MKEPEFTLIGGWIAGILAEPQDEALIRRTRDEVTQLCEAFPLYPDLAG
jgi:glycine/serine hydroxymethyltransferase